MRFIQNPVVARASLMGAVNCFLGSGCFLLVLTLDSSLWQCYILALFGVAVAIMCLVLRSQCLRTIEIDDSGIRVLRRKNQAVISDLLWENCKEVGMYNFRGFCSVKTNIYCSPIKADSNPRSYLPEGAIVFNYREAIMDEVLLHWPQEKIKKW